MKETKQVMIGASAANRSGGRESKKREGESWQSSHVEAFFRVARLQKANPTTRCNS